MAVVDQLRSIQDQLTAHLSERFVRSARHLPLRSASDNQPLTGAEELADRYAFMIVATGTPGARSTLHDSAVAEDGTIRRRLATRALLFAVDERATELLGDLIRDEGSRARPITDTRMEVVRTCLMQLRRIMSPAALEQVRRAADDMSIHMDARVLAIREFEFFERAASYKLTILPEHPSRPEHTTDQIDAAVDRLMRLMTEDGVQDGVEAALLTIASHISTTTMNHVAAALRLRNGRPDYRNTVVATLIAMGLEAVNRGLPRLTQLSVDHMISIATDQVELPSVRCRAIQGVAYLGGTNAGPALEAILSAEKTTVVGRYAATALGMLPNNDFDPTKTTSPRFDTLCKIASDEKATDEVRVQCLVSAQAMTLQDVTHIRSYVGPPDSSFFFDAVENRIEPRWSPVFPTPMELRVAALPAQLAIANAVAHADLAR